MALAAFRLAAAPPPAESWRVWLEPKFMHTAAALPIPGAERTELAAGTLSPAGLEPLPAETLSETRWTDPEFQSRARENARADLARAEIRYQRNRQRIIDYAEVRSPEGLIPSAILAPDFLAKFEATLGPEILLVVPNRQVAFVFPKLASSYQEYAPVVLAEFLGGSAKVSLEVFSLGPKGLQAVGRFNDPRD